MGFSGVTATSAATAAEEASSLERLCSAKVDMLTKRYDSSDIGTICLSFFYALYFVECMSCLPDYSLVNVI